MSVDSSMAMKEGHSAYRFQSHYPPREPLWEDRRMTPDQIIQGMQLQVIRRAAAIGVSAACREAGISRMLLYRWQNRLKQYGLDGLHPRRQRPRSGPPAQLPRHGDEHALGSRSHTRRGAVGAWPRISPAGGA